VKDFEFFSPPELDLWFSSSNFVKLLSYILPALNNRAIEQIPWKASFIIEIVTNFPKFTLFLSLGL